MTPVISVEHLSKSYRLGQIGTGTFANDLNVWWARLRGRPNPLLRIGEADHAGGSEEIWALRDVTFQVQQGEVLGIIGRNGAGKSTLLKILSRVTAPTLGRVRVKGRIASLLEVGTGFHPELTGRENVYLNGAILGMTRAEVRRKFDEIVAFAEVEQFIDTPVKRYSSGMYVRLAFAVAAHLDPEILIVDEVLAVGDAEFQKKCLGKMGDVAHAGRTVLFVSHNMAAVTQLCQKVVYLKNGNLMDLGPTLDIINAYLASDSRNIEQNNHQNLLSHEGRKSNSIRLLKSVCLENSSRPTTDFFIGDSIKAVVNLQVSPEQIKQVYLGFNIRDSRNNIVFATNMNQYGKSLEISHEGDYKVVFIIDNLMFSPGNYQVSLFAGNGSYDIDTIENAISFRVLWKNNPLFSYPPNSKWGPLFIPVKWEIAE